MRDFDDRPAPAARKFAPTHPWSARCRLLQKLLDVTNELAEWFNSVDATYRADLRELNETNFARFDAKLEQRLAELRSEVQTGLATLKGELVAEIGKLRGETTAAIAHAQSTTVKWMFEFWAPTAVGIVLTGVGVVALLLRH